MGDVKTFKSGREFASFLGLVPRQSGTGGKIRLGSISKRGDPYLRTLLIHVARSVMYHAKAPTAWHRTIQARRQQESFAFGQIRPASGAALMRRYGRGRWQGGRRFMRLIRLPAEREQQEGEADYVSNRHMPPVLQPQAD